MFIILLGLIVLLLLCFKKLIKVQKVKRVEEAINSNIIKAGSMMYTSGNAATPQVLLRQLAKDSSIKDVELLSLLTLGDVGDLYTEEVCERVTHRVLFNSAHSRNAINNGTAKYQLMHLSDIPHQVSKYLKPDVVLLHVSGPDNGNNYSLSTTVEGGRAAFKAAKRDGGIVIVECNKQMPFINGTTIHASEIDYLLEVDYPLPVSPVHEPDERALKIGQLISELYIEDGSTLQYGIGEVPEAVTNAILDKHQKDLGIWTELFTDSMRKLVEEGLVTNKYSEADFSVATLFLSGSKEGYKWMHNNSLIQNRPSNRTNSLLKIAAQHKMVAINSAIGVDLHGNIWADSLNARKIYSGIGGQADFLRGSYLSKGGRPIIAMKSTTRKGESKVLDMCPMGITTTAIAADPVIIVTEHGAFNPLGLSLGEHAVGITHLAEPEVRDDLLKKIYDGPRFYKPETALKGKSPKGFISYEEVFGKS